MLKLFLVLCYDTEEGPCHVIADSHSFSVSHDIFLKAPFPGIRRSHENFDSMCGSGLYAVSLRQLVALAFSSKI